MKTLIFFVLMILSLGIWAKEYTLSSPDQKITITVQVAEAITWSAKCQNVKLFDSSRTDLLVGGQYLGENAKVIKNLSSFVSGKVLAVVPIKSVEIPEQYNQLKLILKGGHALVFRAYNEGFGYRWEISFKEKIKVSNELADLNFAGNFGILFPEEENLMSHYERLYLDDTLSTIGKGRFCSLPFLVKAPENIKIGITETDLYDYPNLFFEATGSEKLCSKFPHVILEAKPSRRGADRNLEIVKEADYIAETMGTRSLPWRVFMVSQNDAQLIENQLPYLMARSNELADVSWIKPGMVAWDWWNDNNIYGVDFEAGINTKTYQYYIDFAAKHEIPYIILDEGWSKTTTNVLEPNNQINMEALMEYAKTKKVGIILWTLWGPLDKDMDRILDQFKAWGAKGVKVDFMARADQYMVNFYERTARECAKRELLVDFHGAYKPAGLHRAFPNVVNHEGVRGLENCKWSDHITPEHCVTLPFTRMLAGPMDFTPGAMINANKRNFTISFSTPMSQGTRCHQLAMYVVYDAPLQMMSDNPSNYYKEAETAAFISSIPTVWEETKALEAKVGDYLLVTRRAGSNWYIGAMTDWDARELELDLSFLEEGKYTIEIMQDGPNAHHAANDYTKTSKLVDRDQKIKIKMAPGGGWAAICKKL